MSTNPDMLIALRRSERIMAEQIGEWESLEFGVAHHSTAFAALPEANQLREVWLADVNGETAFARAEEFYSQRGLICTKWTAASGQVIEPVEALLTGKGWKRVDFLAMGLQNYGAAQSSVDPSIRILPARAMRKAYHATFDAAHADAAIERLNDSDLDAFVATMDGQPVGRISYLSVGDVARLADLFVMPAFRRRGIGSQLVSHCLQIARRLVPKVLVSSVESENAVGAEFLRKRGFVEAGRVTEFLRPQA